MWFLGHLGIGSKIARPVSRGLPFRSILLGTILPDLIDKPLYYGAVFLTGRHSREIGILSCSRTVGHSLLFLASLGLVAWIRKSKNFTAVAIGVFTHLLLDGFQDFWFFRVLHGEGESSMILAAFFPFYRPYFGSMPFSTITAHLETVGRPITYVSEIIGGSILVSDFYRRRFRPSYRNESSERKSRAVR